MRPVAAAFTGLVVASVLVAGLLWWRSGSGIVVATQTLSLGTVVSPAVQLSQSVDFGRFPEEVIPSVQARVPRQEVASGPVATVAHDDKFRDVEWFRQQDPDHWVLQVMAGHSESAVQSYIDGREEKADLFYYQTFHEGQPWYVVIYGNYVNRELAIGVADSRDFGQGLRPFAKNLGAILTELTAGNPPTVTTPGASSGADMTETSH